jgi:hypothetical protein
LTCFANSYTLFVVWTTCSIRPRMETGSAMAGRCCA